MKKRKGMICVALMILLAISLPLGIIANADSDSQHELTCADLYVPSSNDYKVEASSGTLTLTTLPDNKGLHLEFVNSTDSDYRTRMDNVRYNLNGMHFSIRNFSGEGMMFSLNSDNAASARSNKRITVQIRNEDGNTAYRYRSKSWPTLTWEHNQTVTGEIPADFDVYFKKVEGGYNMSFYSTASSEPIHVVFMSDESIAEGITDPTQTILQFHAWSTAGSLPPVNNYSFDFVAVHGGEKTCAKDFTEQQIELYFMIEELAQTIITLDSKDTIEEAEQIYESLNAAEKADIINIDKLIKARKTYDILAGPDNLDWMKYSGDVSAKDDDEKEMTLLTGFAEYGNRIYYRYKVKLDGLRVNLEASMFNFDCVGFLFSDSYGAYVGPDNGSPVAFALWRGLYSNGAQSRFHIGEDHNYNKTSVVNVSADPESKKGFDIAGSMVIYSADTMGLSLSFSKYDDDWYKITIYMTASSMWTSNANYNATGGPNGQPTCHVFLPTATVADILDENGELYLIAMGFPSGQNPPIRAYFEIEDDNLRAYKNTELKDAEDALASYNEKVNDIVDEYSYKDAIEARNSLVTAINALRYNDNRIYNQLLNDADDLITSDSSAQDIAKGIIDAKIDAVSAITDTFATESNITQTALTNAEAAYNDAVAEYDLNKAVLSSENQAELEAELNTLNYAIKKAKVLYWIIDYENRIEAINVNSSTALQDIASVNQFRDDFEGSDVENLLNALSNDDKAALENRIEQADEEIAQKEADANDIAAANEVIDLIDDLPETIILDDEDDVAAARTAYDNLTADQKELVTNLNKLTAAEAAIANLRAVGEVINLIDDLPETITLDDEEDVTAARTAYDNLTADQKELVTNLSKLTAAEAAIEKLHDDTEAANEVIALINDLPANIDLKDKDAVQAARAAYNNLTADQKALVTNYSKLTSAEGKISELEKLKGCKTQASEAAVLLCIIAFALVAIFKNKKLEYRR